MVDLVPKLIMRGAGGCECTGRGKVSVRQPSGPRPGRAKPFGFQPGQVVCHIKLSHVILLRDAHGVVEGSGAWLGFYDHPAPILADPPLLDGHGLVGLSLLDAWYTLDLLKRGATEANPVMRAALDVSDQAFVLIKTVITVVGAGFLCLHKNWPLGRVCLVIALMGYSALLFYHLYAQEVSGPAAAAWLRDAVLGLAGLA